MRAEGVRTRSPSARAQEATVGSNPLAPEAVTARLASVLSPSHVSHVSQETTVVPQLENDSVSLAVRRRRLLLRPDPHMEGGPDLARTIHDDSHT